MFESCGTIVNFRFLTSERPDKQMALLEFTNTSSAIGGLVQFHNKEVRETLLKHRDYFFHVFEPMFYMKGAILVSAN